MRALKWDFVPVRTQHEYHNSFWCCAHRGHFVRAMAQAATPVASEHSANNILPGCRFLVAPKPATITSDVSGWSVGLCSGTIDGILTVAVQQRVAMVARYGNAENVPFCSPPTATREEAIRVVVRYLDEHSELKMEEFGSVAT